MSSDDQSATGAEELATLGRPATICETDPLDDPGIYAIDEPVVGDSWESVAVPSRYGEDGTLTDGEVVLGVSRDGRRRAYPLSIVWYHEAVNDEFGGPLLVTYCPLCNSAMIAERTVGGRAATFAVSGQLWMPPEAQTRGSELNNRTIGVSQDAGETDVRNTGNLVLTDDTTGSYWSQILAEAICGPQAGSRLTPVSVTVTTWGEWSERGATEVLLPPPASGTVE